MDNKTRAFIYAFLSRSFLKEYEGKALEDLLANKDIVAMLGQKTQEWFENTPKEEIEEQLNIDFNSLFHINSQPYETLIIDSKAEILVGLQNPLMQFYFNNGYDIDLSNSDILAPDHLSIEFGFMQNLAYRGEDKIAQQFLQKHILEWVSQYLIGLSSACDTPFYQDLFDFTIEFIFSDYEFLNAKVGHEG